MAANSMEMISMEQPLHQLFLASKSPLRAGLRQTAPFSDFAPQKPSKDHDPGHVAPFRGANG